ncbi:MAG: hypothetical protein SPL12_07485 [Bacteroidales bacterium]|nr:hypothetical protein [Bacteroidales bacterium]
MVGGQLNGYGSHAFYSAAYPDQYEATRTLVGSLSSQFRISAYGRLQRDRFELFREGYVDSLPSWYTGHNYKPLTPPEIFFRGAVVFALRIALLWCNETETISNHQKL